MRRRARNDSHNQESAERIALEAADVGIWRVDLATGSNFRDAVLTRIYGMPAGPATVPLEDYFSRVHPDDRARAEEAWQRALEARGGFDVEHRIVRPDGEVRWIRDRGRVVADAGGEPLFVTGAVTDITEIKSAEQTFREHARALEMLIRGNSLLTGELDLEKLVQLVTDVATELIGAQFGAFFHNVTDERGEGYQLYTLSGAPREAFARFPMPRNTSVFGPTFRGAAIVRSADITQDPRYGKNPPYRGMPEGHLPVRSYLAAPVTSRSGAVLGGLFFGHREEGVFTELAERLISGVAAQAAIAIDNARLYHAAQAEIGERTRAEEQQRFLLAELSHRVKNTLAIVQAIARQTAGRASTVAAFQTAFDGRLSALAAAHSLLTENAWRSVSLVQLVRVVLAAYMVDDRVDLELEDTALTPAAGQTFALVFHELATNAAKYGALSTSTGHVRLTGRIAAEPDALQVLWVESGGPPVKRPDRPGYGINLVREILGYQYGGAVELDWQPTGLVCRLSVPRIEIVAGP